MLSEEEKKRRRRIYQRKMWFKISVLGLHPKHKKDGPWMIVNGEPMYNKYVKFEDLVDYIVRAVKREAKMKSVINRTIMSGKTKGENRKQKLNSQEDLVSDFLRDKYGVNTEDIISISKYVRDCLSKLHDNNMIDRDYKKYISSLNI